MVARSAATVEDAAALYAERLDEWSLVVVSLLHDAEQRLAFVRDVAASSRGGALPVWIVEPLFEKRDPEPLWSLGVNVFLDKATSPNEVSDLLNELLRGDSAPPDRRHLKTSSHFPVELCVQDENVPMEVYARAVGRTAIFLQVTEPKRLGSAVRIRFRLPGGERIVCVEGEVVYTRPGRRESDTPAGMGVKFRDLDPADVAALDEYLSRLAYKVNEKSVIFGL